MPIDYKQIPNKFGKYALSKMIDHAFQLAVAGLVSFGLIIWAKTPVTSGIIIFALLVVAITAGLSRFSRREQSFVSLLHELCESGYPISNKKAAARWAHDVWVALGASPQTHLASEWDRVMGAVVVNKEMTDEQAVECVGRGRLWLKATAVKVHTFSTLNFPSLTPQLRATHKLFVDIIDKSKSIDSLEDAQGWVNSAASLLRSCGQTRPSFDNIINPLLKDNGDVDYKSIIASAVTELEVISAFYTSIDDGDKIEKEMGSGD